MPAKTELEKVLEEKVKPIINEAMHKFLGITIDELSADITDKLKRNPWVDVGTDIGVPFRTAKKIFRRRYLTRLLETNYGNISRIASLSGLDRRTIHRLIKELNIDIDKFRKELMKPEYVKKVTIKNIIDATLDSYKSVIQHKKLEEMYKSTATLSADILKELPLAPLSLKEAEREFEKDFLQKVLEFYKDNVGKAARKIGLRYETLHRKIKKLGI